MNGGYSFRESEKKSKVGLDSGSETEVLSDNESTKGKRKKDISPTQKSENSKRSMKIKFILFIAVPILVRASLILLGKYLYSRRKAYLLSKKEEKIKKKYFKKMNLKSTLSKKNKNVKKKYLE